MVKLGLIQTKPQSTNQKGIFEISKILKKLDPQSKNFKKTREAKYRHCMPARTMAKK